MPFHAAAQALNLHDTQLQRICRKVNIQKWPYQQVVAGKFKRDLYIYIYIYIYIIVINFFIAMNLRATDSALVAEKRSLNIHFKNKTGMSTIVEER